MSRASTSGYSIFITIAAAVGGHLLSVLPRLPRPAIGLYTSIL
jgi:hypothetical protein